MHNTSLLTSQAFTAFCYRVRAEFILLVVARCTNAMQNAKNHDVGINHIIHTSYCAHYADLSENHSGGSDVVMDSSST